MASKKNLLPPCRRGRELFFKSFISPELKKVVRYWWRADVYPQYRQLWPGWWQCWCGKAAVPDQMSIQRAVSAVKMLCALGADPAVLPRMAFIGECPIPERTWPGDDPRILKERKKAAERAGKGLAEARTYFEALPASPHPELYCGGWKQTENDILKS